MKGDFISMSLKAEDMPKGMFEQKNLEMVKKNDVYNYQEHLLEEDKKQNSMKRKGAYVSLAVLLCVVGYLNYSVIDIINNIIKSDNGLISSGKLAAIDRTINYKVILSLVGGTVTQTSAMLFFAVKYFFPKETAHTKQHKA